MITIKKPGDTISLVMLGQVVQLQHYSINKLACRKSEMNIVNRLRNLREIWILGKTETGYLIKEYLNHLHFFASWLGTVTSILIYPEEYCCCG